MSEFGAGIDIRHQIQADNVLFVSWKSEMDTVVASNGSPSNSTLHDRLCVKAQDQHVHR